ncbi:MAG: tetratricopeptide repeat protein [Kiloniellales bacterium]|nr:tetratricopeptide repeat protein [Kiloniellales bacterium]
MVRKTVVGLGLGLMVLSACAQEPPPPELLAARGEAEALSDKGRVAEAILFLETASEISEREFGPDHPEHARSLTQLGWFHERRQNYAAAEPLYRRALAIREAALGAKHIDVARSLNTLGQLHFHQGRYFEATVALDRANLIVATTRGLVPEHQELAHRSLGKAYLWDQNPAAAAWHLEEALAIEESMPEPDDHRIAETLHDLATAYSFLGKGEKAEPLHLRSLNLREGLRGSEHPEVAESLTGLAINLYVTEKYEDAETLLLRAMAIREKALGAEHADVGRTRSHLAEVYFRKSDVARALALNDEALRITEAARGPNHGDTVSVLTQRADFFAKLHRFVEARSVLRRILDTQPKRSPNVLRWQAKMLQDLGATADDKGETAIATSFYEMALEVRQKDLIDGTVEQAIPAARSRSCRHRAGEPLGSTVEIELALAVRDEAIVLKDSAVAKTLNTLAVLYRNNCDLAKAEETAGRALAVAVKVFGEMRRETGTAMRTLASVHAAKGELDKAEPLYRAALVILDRTKEPPHAHLALRLSELGRAAEAKGQASLAKSYHLMALQARELQQWRLKHRHEHSDLVPTLLKLAEGHVRRGKPEKAEPLYRHVIAVWEGTGGIDPTTFAGTLDAYAGLLRRLGREEAAKPYEERAKAIRAALRRES